jgi:hypothetical protein
MDTLIPKRDKEPLVKISGKVLKRNAVTFKAYCEMLDEVDNPGYVLDKLFEQFLATDQKFRSWLEAHPAAGEGKAARGGNGKRGKKSKDVVTA